MSVLAQGTDGDRCDITFVDRRCDGARVGPAHNIACTGLWNPEGDFFALDAKNGNKLWSYQTGAGHRGSAVSYSVNGRQYIATPTGWHSSVVGALAQSLFPDQDWRLGSTLVVFALPEGSR
jgi:outer membrane protein assembly factor BamB